MRKGFERLHGLVSEKLQRDVRSGALFVFTNKRRTRLKVPYFDGTGLWLMTKRHIPHSTLPLFGVSRGFWIGITRSKDRHFLRFQRGRKHLPLARPPHRRRAARGGRRGARTAPGARAVCNSLALNPVRRESTLSGTSTRRTRRVVGANAML